MRGEMQPLLSRTLGSPRQPATGAHSSLCAHWLRHCRWLAFLWAPRPPYPAGMSGASRHRDGPFFVGVCIVWCVRACVLCVLCVNHVVPLRARGAKSRHNHAGREMRGHAARARGAGARGRARVGGQGLAHGAALSGGRVRGRTRRMGRQPRLGRGAPEAVVLPPMPKAHHDCCFCELLESDSGSAVGV